MDEGSDEEGREKGGKLEHDGNQKEGVREKERKGKENDNRRSRAASRVTHHASRVIAVDRDPYPARRHPENVRVLAIDIMRRRLYTVANAVQQLENGPNRRPARLQREPGHDKLLDAP